MPSIPQRGFIIRPAQESIEPEPACIAGTSIGSMYYSNIRREDAEPELAAQVSSDYYPNVPASEGYVPVYNGILSGSLLHSVEERIKDKMLGKIEDFLESNQLNELSVLVTVYEKFKELHP